VRRIFFLVFALAAANLTLFSFASAPPGQQSPAAAPSATAAQPAQNNYTVAVVVLDPAHGGADAGARGPAGAVESEIVLGFARAIRVALEGQGVRTLLTREGNEDPTMDSRSTVANSLRGAVFISLHVSSTGPIGTARTYWYAFPGDAGPPAASTSAPAVTPPQRGLVSWDRAQQAFLNPSRRLAELVQIQLAQKFKGSAETPSPAAVLQLRTIAAPAIAIEISSVAVPNAQQLVDMARPLAEAVSRALVDFRSQPGGASGVPGGAHQ
jgi:N-acetylmuramoyl-L-alanine amidase